MGHSKSTLLICTVGGTPEPVVAALKHWQPRRVYFVATPQTAPEVEKKVVPAARTEGVDLDPGRYDVFELPDAQDFAACLDRLRSLTPKVEEWVVRGADFQVVVDFTGGTKCMSAAIALQASRWPCLFSYVGGGERTKGGVGVVVSGTERVLYQANPWDALGYQAVEDFIVLFDRHAFLSAADIAQVAKTRVSEEHRKREFAALQNLAMAFDAWDRFDHSSARRHFDDVNKMANDLRAALGSPTGEKVLTAVQVLRAHVDGLCHAEAPSRHHVLDLLANARRRKEEGRFDDAVARLYRAIEAVAQVALKEGHGIASTEKVPLDPIPEPLRSRWEPRSDGGVVALGLQDAYALLAALQDPLGQRFRELKLDGTTSPLAARNRSILAHGFEKAPQSVVDHLWAAALDLAGVREQELPSFPTLKALGEP